MRTLSSDLDEKYNMSRVGVVDLLFLVKVFVIVFVLVVVVVVVVSVVLIDYSTIKNHEDQGGQCGSGIPVFIVTIPWITPLCPCCPSKIAVCGLVMQSKC